MARPKRKAISYIRFSTPKQAKGDSYRRQIEAARAYCDKNNLELDDSILLDAGVSGFKGKNVTEGSLGRFIEGVTNGSIPKDVYLIIESLDRLTRLEVSKAVSLLLDITDLGVTIVTLFDGRIYTKSPDVTHLIISLTCMQRAHEESLTKSKRLSASWNRKKKEAVEGKVVTSVIPAWLEIVTDNRGNKSFKVIEKKANSVRKAFKLLASGLGRTATVRALNEQGVLAPTGKPWARTSLARLVTTGAVIGHYQPHTGSAANRTPEGNVIKDYYPPIINEDVYWAVFHRSKAMKGSNAVRHTKLNNLFSKIAKCACCGSSMYYADKGCKTQIYLACSNRTRGLGCSMPYMNYSQVEIVVLTLLARAGKTLIEPTYSHSKLEIEAKRGQLNDVEAQLDRITDAIAQVGLNERMSTKLVELNAQEAELKEWLKGAETVPTPMSPEEQLKLLSQRADDLKTRQELYRLFLSSKLNLVIGNEYIELDGVKVRRTFNKGFWTWRSDTGILIGFEMENWEKRLSGLKSKQQPKLKAA